MADEKKGGWLARNFKKAAIGALKLATVGVAAAVSWQLFLDPLFFLPIHDPTNVTMQAWVSFMNDSFGWIPDIVGATGDGGLLNTEFAQSVLEPYKGLSPMEMNNTNYADAISTTATQTTANNSLTGISLGNL